MTNVKGINVKTFSEIGIIDDDEFMHIIEQKIYITRPQRRSFYYLHSPLVETCRFVKGSPTRNDKFRYKLLWQNTADTLV